MHISDMISRMIAGKVHSACLPESKHDCPFRKALLDPAQIHTQVASGSMTSTRTAQRNKALSAPIEPETSADRNKKDDIMLEFVRETKTESESKKATCGEGRGVRSFEYQVC
jgi:hypothetical protein